MDLPTYTSIWRIEKRLYKLYDFRLPMPLPVGQIAVFAAITVPYVVILKILGLPFSHTLLWLYILPPGALTWLVTRPVLEGKRLPELVVSQLRYLAEPRTWCRMAPLAEKDEIAVVARVWRRVNAEAAGGQIEAASVSAALAAGHAEMAGRSVCVAPDQAEVVEPPTPTGTRPERAAAVQDAAAEQDAAVQDAAAERAAAVQDAAVQDAAAEQDAAVQYAASPASAPAAPAAAPASAAHASPRSRPVVTVTGDRPGERPLRAVERALGNPSERRAIGWHDRVAVVPGGDRPGRPDQLVRDRARARMPVPGGRRVAVLGCMAGAGQTVTTLMTGELLASLRDDQVAVLDLNPGTGSLAQRARAVPALTGSRPPAPSRLEVVSHAATGGRGPGKDQEDITKIFELVSARYPLTLADPAPAAVPRVLAAANQLILVAPANQDAASALAATREWLEAHGHCELADAAIIVLNGVSRRTAPHVEQAEAVASGRCRAIVRVPWDAQLGRAESGEFAPPDPGARSQPAARSIRPAALRAYTALAGVLAAGLAGAPEQLRARS